MTTEAILYQEVFVSFMAKCPCNGTRQRLRRTEVFCRAPGHHIMEEEPKGYAAKSLK